MLPPSWSSRKKEPRQPQDSKGQLVFTTESPEPEPVRPSNPAERQTEALVHAAIIGEAEASVAIDAGDDGTYAVEGGLPRTSTPPTKKETMSRKAKQPRGQATVDVQYAFDQIGVGQEFNAITVWNKMTQGAQTRWKSAYGNKRGAISHIRSVLNTEYHKGRNVTLTQVEGVMSTYVMESHDAKHPKQKRTPSKNVRKGGVRTNTPTGGQAGTVLAAIEENATFDVEFGSVDVWMWMSANARAEWRDLYGGVDKAKRKVTVSINNILNRTNKPGFKRVDGVTGTYVSTTLGKVSVDKPASKPATVKHTRATEHEGFRDIGVDHDGVPLYIEHSTGRVGHVRVVTQFVAV